MTTRNLILGSGIRVTSMLLIVVTPMVAARLLPPAGVAQVMIAISIGTIIGVVGPLGLPWAISYRVAQVRVGAAETARLSADLRAALGYLGAVLVALALLVGPTWAMPPRWVIPGATREMLLAVVIIGVARATSKVLSEVNKGFGDVNTAAVGADLAGPIMALILMFTVAALASDLSSTEVLWCLAFGWLAAVAYTVGSTPVRPWGHRPPAATSSRRGGLAVLAIISVLNVGIQQAHIVISGFALGLDEAATFTTAARLATLTGAPLVIISGLASPDIGVALHSKDGPELERVQARLQRLTGAFFAASVLLCLVYALVGGRLLRLLFGTGYEAGHAELVVLAIGPLGSLLAGVVGMTLMLAGKHRRLLRDTVVGSAVAAVAMLIGVRWGAVGLAVGYTTGQLVINALLLRTCRAVTGLSPMASPASALVWAIHAVGRRAVARKGG